jgi:hypothetical protein
MALTAQQQSLVNQSTADQAAYQAKAADQTNQYNTAKAQAGTAQGNIDSFNQYMQGAGSAANLYKNAFSDNASNAGYNADTLKASQANVSQATGAQSAYNDYANTAASKWGLNAGALAAGNANAQSSLNNNISAASTTLGTQQKAYDAATNATNQQASLGVQQQQTQQAGYKQAYDAAFSQQQTASSMVQFYTDEAQKQGGLTASQWQSFENANAAAASAQQSLAQASQLMAQTKIAQDQNAYMQKNLTGAYAPATPAAAPSSQPSQSSNGNWFDNSAAWLDKNVNNPIGSAIGGAAGNVANWWNKLPTW